MIKVRLATLKKGFGAPLGLWLLSHGHFTIGEITPYDNPLLEAPQKLREPKYINRKSPIEMGS